MAFVVSSDHIQEIASIMSTNIKSSDEDYGKELRYRVEFPAGGSVNTTSLDEVLAIPNSGNKQIKALRISTGLTVRPRMEIEFDCSPDYSNVTYEVTGAEEAVYFVAGQLTEVIQRTRMWYTRISRSDVAGQLEALVVLFALGTIVFGLLAATQGLPDQTYKISERAVGMTLVSFGSVIVLLIAGRALKIRERLFPVGIFTLGDGLRRYEKILFWRRSVLGFGIILPVGVNLVTALMID